MIVVTVVDMTEVMIVVAGKCFSRWNNTIAIWYHNSKLIALFLFSCHSSYGGRGGGEKYFWYWNWLALEGDKASLSLSLVEWLDFVFVPLVLWMAPADVMKLLKTKHSDDASAGSTDLDFFAILTTTTYVFCTILFLSAGYIGIARLRSWAKDNGTEIVFNVATGGLLVVITENSQGCCTTRAWWNESLTRWFQAGQWACFVFCFFF